jgi:hypothetical protein
VAENKFLQGRPPGILSTQKLIIIDETHHGSSFFIHFITNAFHFDIDNTTAHMLGKPSGALYSFVALG